MKKVLFREEQRFTQWWLWLILGFTLLAVVVPLANAITEGQTQVNSSNSARLVLYGILSVLFLTAVIAVILFIKLKTKITESGISLIFFPFIRKWKEISFQEIEKYEIRRYRAILEYGGYGMRKRRKVGQAFSISGNMGLQLYLKNGKKLLIGTQKKKAIEHAMGKLMGEGKKVLPKEMSSKKHESPAWRKTKKILIIMAIEIVLAIVIFSLIQIFK